MRELGGWVVREVGVGVAGGGTDPGPTWRRLKSHDRCEDGPGRAAPGGMMTSLGSPRYTAGSSTCSRYFR